MITPEIVFAQQDVAQPKKNENITIQDVIVLANKTESITQNLMSTTENLQNITQNVKDIANTFSGGGQCNTCEQKQNEQQSNRDYEIIIALSFFSSANLGLIILVWKKRSNNINDAVNVIEKTLPNLPDGEKNTWLKKLQELLQKSGAHQGK